MKGTVRTFSFVLTLVAAVAVIAGGALYLDEPALYAGPDQLAEPAPPSATAGPLYLRPQNSRYFTDASGRPVYLTGSHTWNNLQDIGRTDPPVPFDFDEYLRFMRQHRHNFIRLWRWETSQLTVREWKSRALHRERTHGSAAAGSRHSMASRNSTCHSSIRRTSTG